ncbi:MAG: extracellular solute-binding protein [Deltaproteobacteria bacterium]|nr:extracellular solute-binding protein [Deltaproteobacteria bacterium]
MADLRAEKLFSILFGILLGVLLFVLPAGAGVLRMIGPEDVGGAWAEVIKRFHERYPDIQVKYISGPWSTDERQNMYIRSFLSGDPIELVYMDVIWTAKFAERGWLMPLDGWFTPEMQTEFLPGAVEAGRCKGHSYRVPVRGDVGMLYYRKDLVPEPPKTWKEFERICERRSCLPEMYCIVFQGMQYEGLVCDFLEYLWGAGGEVIDPEGNVVLDCPEALEALRFMRKLIRQGWVPRAVLTFQEQHSLSAFSQGKALFMRNWPYAWTILNKEDAPLRGKVGIVPFIHKEGYESAGTLGGWGLGIAQGVKDPEKVWRFIAFATSAEAQKILHFKRGAVPSRKALFKDPEILKVSPHYRDLYEIVMRARPRPVHPDYPRISDTLQKHVSAVLAGIESPEEALKIMARSIEGIVRGEKEGFFARLGVDYDLKRTLLNTIVFTSVSVPLEFILGLLIALLVNAHFRGRSFIRLAVLIPWALPTAVMAMSWQWMFNNPFGVINDLLVRIGLLSAPLDWLSSPNGAMSAAVFADVWKTTPFVVIILLAGLQSIPQELAESISIDGAGALREFLHLTFPLLLPFVRVALIFRVIHAAGIFDLIWVLTKGGPADSTRTLGIYIYDVAFRYDEVGYAIFLTVLFLLALIGVSFLIVRLTSLGYERVR